MFDTAERSRNDLGLILVEAEGEWVLTPRFDPRLQVGSQFRLLGLVWTVTWDSETGFGLDTIN